MKVEKDKVLKLLNSIPKDRITLITPEVNSYPDTYQPKELYATISFEWKNKEAM